MPPRTKTPTWKQHRARWSKCRECDLCSKRSRIVLGRGTVPCDVLFVGEAPGAAEDTIGKPFVGPAGKLLDEIIETAIIRAGLEDNRPKLAFTYLLACVPKYKAGQIGQPKKPEIDQCTPRLNEAVQIAKPQAIVMVGALSSKWSPKVIDYDFEYSADLQHPAAILRESVVKKDISIDRCIVKLVDLFYDIGLAEDD